MTVVLTQKIATYIDEYLNDISSEKFRQIFSDYKASGVAPRIFGRDVAYDSPLNMSSVLDAELKHIHLIDSSYPFPRKRQFEKTSDHAHLVYCESFNSPGTFCLIAILSPNPHDKSKDNSTMAELASIASRFRENDRKQPYA